MHTIKDQTSSTTAKPNPYNTTDSTARTPVVRGANEKPSLSVQIRIRRYALHKQNQHEEAEDLKRRINALSKHITTKDGSNVTTEKITVNSRTQLWDGAHLTWIIP